MLRGWRYEKQDQVPAVAAGAGSDWGPSWRSWGEQEDSAEVGASVPGGQGIVIWGGDDYGAGADPGARAREPGSEAADPAGLGETSGSTRQTRRGPRCDARASRWTAHRGAADAGTGLRGAVRGKAARTALAAVGVDRPAELVERHCVAVAPNRL